MNGAVLIVTLLILMLLQHELLKHFGMRGLKYTRHFARKTAFDAYMLAAEAALCWAEHGIDLAMNRYNKRHAE